MIGILLFVALLLTFWADPKTFRNIALATLAITLVIYWSLKVFGL